MANQYNHDWIDGRQVPPLVIHENYVLNYAHAGSVHVESGRFKLAGVLQGSLDIQSGVSAIITGTQQGSVSIASGSVVTVYGAIEGSTNVESGGTLIIEEGGKLSGSLANHGKVILRGLFGGNNIGAGELKIEDKGRIIQPIVKDGINYYEF